MVNLKRCGIFASDNISGSYIALITLAVAFSVFAIGDYHQHCLYHHHHRHHHNNPLHQQEKYDLISSTSPLLWTSHQIWIFSV